MTRLPLLAVAAIALLAVPAASAETILPCRQPQLASSADAVYVACGTPTAILVARSADGGRTFAAPARIAVAGHLALGNHRGPRIAASGSDVIVTAIVGAIGGGKDGDVLAWRSTDEGRRWSSPVVISDVSGSAREGLHALTRHESTVTVAWLDLREKGTSLAVATSTDDGRTWEPDVIAYRSPSGGICECCHPSLATDWSRRVVAMFRNNVDGNRDMYVIGSRDGKDWTPAGKLGRDSWTLAACPMDGGDIRYDSKGNAIAVWRRGQTVYLTSLTDDASAAQERRVGDGVNPALTMTATGPAVAWNSPEGLQLIRGDAPPILIEARGRFASLAAHAKSLVAAFERGEESVIRVY
jgi:hypothetical protein